MLSLQGKRGIVGKSSLALSRHNHNVMSLQVTGNPNNDVMGYFSSLIFMSLLVCKFASLGISYYGVIYFDELSSYWEIPSMMS